MTYPGGKNGMGVYQRIINHMPPHKVYVEAFLGSGAVLRNKHPAERNIGIDRSQDAISLCQKLAGDRDYVEYVKGNTLELLHSRDFATYEPGTLLYCDPPYVMATRKGRELYDHEMSDTDHTDLLILLNNQRCMVMVSGCRSALYDHALKDWIRIDYMTQTRQGMVEECLWMNFPDPIALHDYSHLGANFRERERIKRKKDRWMNRLRKMDKLERQAILAGLDEINESTIALNGDSSS